MLAVFSIHETYTDAEQSAIPKARYFSYRFRNEKMLFRQ